jgi:hypothetical protein
MKQPYAKSSIFDIENYCSNGRPPLVPVRIQIQKSKEFKYNPSRTTYPQQQYYQTVNGQMSSYPFYHYLYLLNKIYHLCILFRLNKM